MPSSCIRQGVPLSYNGFSRCCLQSRRGALKGPEKGQSKCEKDIVMKDKKVTRDKRIIFRMTLPEYEKIQQQWANSTCRKLSDFLRRRLLDKPLTTTYRNRSLDDFMAEMIQLRKELNHIGNNFNQAIHKLHMADTDAEIKVWLTIHREQGKCLLEHTEKIKQKINSIADEWLQ